MGFKITNEELDLFLKYAEGNVAILFLLIAIRCAEQGGPGREMGVLDKRANNLEKQVRWARNTILNNESRFEKKQPSLLARSPNIGLFTDAFLEYFSGVYAPIGAKNDPQSLNKNHLKNLRFFHVRCRVMLGEVA